jgi:ribosomal protein S18 acetylase RimI-like enzyme
MEIRRLAATDLDHYFALRLEMLRNAPDAFLMTEEEALAKGPAFYAGILERARPENAIYGAFEGGVLVGAAGVYGEDRPKTSHKASLWGMYVQPASRGKGLGDALVAAVIAHAQGSMGAKVLLLGVEGKNTKARALYERMGFRVWGTEPRAFRIGSNFHDEHHMVLEL